MLSPALLDFLIELGEAGGVKADGAHERADYLIGDGSFMRREPGAWEDLAHSLSDTQIERLIKGVTLAERDFSACYAGSVSPAIWLVRIFAGRCGDDIGELVDWVRANTRNDYLPFGMRRDFEARSMTELVERQAAYQNQRQAEKVADGELRRLAKANEASMKARKSQERASWNLIRAIERSDQDAIKRWLRDGADVNFANGDGVSASELAREKGLGHLFVGALPSSVVEN